MMNISTSIFVIFCMLLAVAFFTLLERKVLGYMAIRKGPNKPSVSAIFLPFADAVKLFSKEFNIPMNSNFLVYLMAPVVNFFFMLMLWMLFPVSYSNLFFTLSLIFFLCISSLSVYTIMASGWASNSKYAFLGALRGVAQTISYEVSLVFLLLVAIYLSGSFSLYNMFILSEWNCLLVLPIVVMWTVVCLAETNRAPLDFAEGESELVSGFNVEYSGGGFIFVFMAEYGNILFLSVLTSLMFLGSSNFLLVIAVEFFTIKVIFFSFMFIWLRASMPRFRYDLLMELAWKYFLPVAMVILFFSIMLNYFLFT